MRLFHKHNIIFCILVLLTATACDSMIEDSKDVFSVSPRSLTFNAHVSSGFPEVQYITIQSESHDVVRPSIYYETASSSIFEEIQETTSSEKIILAVQVKRPRELGVGEHNASIEIANFEYAVTVQVVYIITPDPPGEPRVDTISPHIAAPSETCDAIIRGSGFSNYDNSNLPAITAGGVVVDNITIISDTEIHVTVPPLPVGTYHIGLSGNGLLFASTAELKVMDELMYETTSFITNGEKGSLIYDRERRSVYFVNKSNGILERYRYQEGTNWSFDSLSLSGLSDAALSADGKTLVLVNGSSFYEVDPSSSILSIEPSVANYVGTSDPVNTIASINNNKMIACGENQWSSVYVYDIDLDEFYRLTDPSKTYYFTYSFLRPNLFEVKNGSRLYLGETGSTGSALYEMNSSDMTISDSIISTGLSGYYSLSSSPAFNVFVINGNEIYDSNFSLISMISDNNNCAVISPDCIKVYTFIDNISTNALRAYDISSPSMPQQAGADVSLTPSPGLRSKMVISGDGNTMFILGTESLYIIDLTSFSF